MYYSTPDVRSGWKILNPTWASRVFTRPNMTRNAIFYYFEKTWPKNLDPSLPNPTTPLVFDPTQAHRWAKVTVVVNFHPAPFQKKSGGDGEWNSKTFFRTVVGLPLLLIYLTL